MEGLCIELFSVGFLSPRTREIYLRPARDLLVSTNQSCFFLASSVEPVFVCSCGDIKRGSWGQVNCALSLGCVHWCVQAQAFQALFSARVGVGVGIFMCVILL